MTMLAIANLFMVVFSVLAVWFANLETSIQTRKMASLFGVLAQPFWFYVAIATNQTGILVLTFIYSFCWGMGFYNNWIKKTDVV